MPTPIPRAVQAVRSWIFDPTAVTTADAAEALRRAQCTPDTAMAVDRQLVTLDERGAAAPVCDFSDVPASYFLSDVAMGTATDALATRVDAAAQLTSVRGFDIQLVTPGECFSTPLLADEATTLTAFVTSVKTDGYFDFVVYSGANNAAAATYSQRETIPGLRHSGDIGALLHTVVVDRGLAEASPLVLGVVGFGSKPLVQFVNQVPFVCIPDYARRTIFVVPCPLEEAAVQANTMACLVVGKRVGEHMQWTVMDAPRCCAGVDTNTMDARVVSARDSAISAAGRLREAFERASLAAVPTTPAVSSVTSSAKAPGATTAAASGAATTAMSTQAKCVVIAVEQGLDRVFRGLSTLKVPRSHVPVVASFGSGLAVAAGQAGSAADAVAALQSIGVATEAAPVVLPLASATVLRGSSALALGQSYRSPATTSGATVPAQAYVAALRSAAVRIVHVSDRMLEQVRDTTSELVEGLFVLHAAKAPTADLERHLNGINASAVTSMAGPLSMVVVEMEGKRYWYRGVPWPGVFEGDRVPLFGERVTDELSDERVLKLCCGNGGSAVTTGLPRASFSKASTKCYFAPALAADLQSKPASAWIEALLAMSPDELSRQRSSCELLFAQLPVMLPPVQLEPITASIVGHVNKTVDAMSAALKAELEAAIKKKADAAVINDVGRRLHAQARDARRKLQWLVDLVGRCISTTRSSSRAFDLNRLMRKAVISGNVTAAKSMTFTQVCELLDRECHPDLGAAIAHFNSGAVSLLVRSISRGTFLKDRATSPAYAANSPNPLVELCPRMLVLDSITVGALKESESTVTPLHSMTKAQVSLALVGLDKRPALPLPLFTRYVEAVDPTVFKWPDEANDASIACLRILLRGTVSSCTESRSATISPSALDLGYGIVYVVLNAMLSLVGPAPTAASSQASASAVRPPLPSFDDTKAQTMRGLFGLLTTTLASGQRPISPAWQLLSDPWRVEAPFPDQWWIYDGMLRCLPATGWQLPKLAACVRRLLVQVVRKHVTDIGVGSMRKACTRDDNKAQAAADVEQRDAEYALTATLSTVLITLASSFSVSSVFAARAAIAAQVETVGAKVVRVATYRRGNLVMHRLFGFFTATLPAATTTLSDVAEEMRAVLKLVAVSVAQRSAPYAATVEELCDSLCIAPRDSTASASHDDAVKTQHQAAMAATPTAHPSAALALHASGSSDSAAATTPSVAVPYAVGLLYGSTVASSALAECSDLIKRVTAAIQNATNGAAPVPAAPRPLWNAIVREVLLGEVPPPPPSQPAAAIEAPKACSTSTAVVPAVAKSSPAAVPTALTPSVADESSVPPAPTASAAASPASQSADAPAAPAAPAARQGKWKGWGPVVNIFPVKPPYPVPVLQQVAQAAAGAVHVDPTAAAASPAAPSSTGAKAPSKGPKGGKKVAPHHQQQQQPSTAAPAAPKPKAKGWGPVVEIIVPKPADAGLSGAVARPPPTQARSAAAGNAKVAPTLQVELGETGFATPQALMIASTVEHLTVRKAFSKLADVERASVEGWFAAVTGGSERAADECLRAMVRAQLVHWSDESFADAASTLAVLLPSLAM